MASSYGSGCRERRRFAFSAIRLPSLTLRYGAPRPGAVASASAGWRAQTFHFNLDLAARIPNVYDELCELDDEFIGDWLFSEAAFGISQSRSSEFYLDQFACDPETGREDKALREYLIHLQKEVIPAFIDDCLDQLDVARFDVVGFTSVFQQNVAALSLARRLSVYCGGQFP